MVLRIERATSFVARSQEKSNASSDVTVRVDNPGTRDYLGIAVTSALSEVRSLRVVRGGSISFSQ